MQTLGQTFGIANMVVPQGGPKCVPLNVDFTAAAIVTLDGSSIVSQGKIEYLQGVFIDNSANVNNLSLTMSTTGQTLICPKKSQGYFSIMVPDPPQIQANANGVGLVIPMFFYNVPIQPAVWSVA
jgi:hypothetical protein